jgi:hypothetical protein
MYNNMASFFNSLGVRSLGDIALDVCKKLFVDPVVDLLRGGNNLIEEFNYMLKNCGLF